MTPITRDISTCHFVRYSTCLIFEIEQPNTISHVFLTTRYTGPKPFRSDTQNLRIQKRTLRPYYSYVEIKYRWLFPNKRPSQIDFAKGLVLINALQKVLRESLLRHENSFWISNIGIRRFNFAPNAILARVLTIQAYIRDDRVVRVCVELRRACT